MKKPITIILKSLLAVAALLLITVAAYLLYVVFSYSRIDDKTALDVGGEGRLSFAETETEYTAVTQNIGFGAYTPQFTFFMDGGKQSRAESAESVLSCVEAAAETVCSFEPDFAFFQEVDTDSDRSFHIDQRKLIGARFSGYAKIFAVNYHSAFLFYPLNQPHGASNSGMATYSSVKAVSAERRSLPVSSGFGKFLDLDRCYSVTRIPVNNGKELVLYNAHTSAYGGSDEIRSAQMNMLLGDMQSEYEKGNYCVCGGDFNHDFTGNSTQLLNGGETAGFGWAQPFPEDILKKYGGIRRADEYDNGEIIPTCRNCDVPYDENTFTLIVDGFLISANVEAVSLRNIDTQFAYSDHNPVVMKFILKD